MDRATAERGRGCGSGHSIGSCARFPSGHLKTVVMNKINALPEDVKLDVEVMVKVDQGVKLSVVQEVKERLSTVSVRKVHYVALPKDGN